MAQAILLRSTLVPPIYLVVHRGAQFGESASKEMTNFMGLTGHDLILGDDGEEAIEVSVRGVFGRDLRLARSVFLVFILFASKLAMKKIT